MRPAIAVPIPARQGPFVLLDAGANADLGHGHREPSGRHVMEHRNHMGQPSRVRHDARRRGMVDLSRAATEMIEHDPAICRTGEIITALGTDQPDLHPRLGPVQPWW